MMRLLDFLKYKDSVVEQSETFDKEEALVINQARLDHLASLNLPLAGKTILDVGAGVGHLAQFFVKKNCPVLCLEGRPENIKALKEKYPNLNNILLDVERDDLSALGFFEVIFCYGLLYHTENPALVIEKLSNLCREIMLLETCITDQPEPLVKYIEETATSSQALKGMSSRPTTSLIISLLKKCSFTNVYLPKYPPRHSDFIFKDRGDLAHQRNGYNLRRIFIATKNINLNRPTLNHVA